MSRYSLLYALTGVLAVAALTAHSMAQTNAKSDAPHGKVILTKLSPPVYPQIARTAHVTGDVELDLEVRRDGTVELATAVSGPPLLTRAALESAQQSQFECRQCTKDVTSYRLLYTFQLIVTEGSCNAPEDCGRTFHAQVGPTTTQSGDHITVTDGAATECICDVIRRVRSLKCLYLWRCGVG